MRLAPWVKRAGISGSLASLTSTAALGLCGVRDGTSALAPVNAVSHWVWGDKALRRDDLTLSHTVTGYAIHHAMSVLWGLAYEGWRGPVANGVPGSFPWQVRSPWRRAPASWTCAVRRSG